MPVADRGAWDEFLGEITTGSRAADHRAFLARGGVTAEHVFLQPTPMGDLMVIIWEGVDSATQAAHLGSVLENPTTDHERYLRDYVIPKVHGIDTSGPKPPASEYIGTITP